MMASLARPLVVRHAMQLRTLASLRVPLPVTALSAQPRQLRCQSQYGPSSFMHSERARGPVEPPHAEYFQEQPPPPPPRKKRSFILRLLWVIFKYGSLITLAGWCGKVAGFIELPPGTRAALQFLISGAQTPTDEETLKLYNPMTVQGIDARARKELLAINRHILQHPLAEMLRREPKFSESRPHMKIPEPIRPINLTSGALAGPGRIAVPPLVFSEDGGKSMVAIFYLGEQLCGHPGIVHGGMLATLLDEGLARCCFPALPNKLGVTAKLSIDYRKPAMANRYYVLRAFTDNVDGRKAFVSGWIEELKDDDGMFEELFGEKSGTSDEEFLARKKRINVEAHALFVEPKGLANLPKALKAA